MHAEAGVGKSALLADAITRATDFTILRTAGYVGDADLPYAGLWDLLSPIADVRDHLPSSAAATISAALALGDHRDGTVDPLAVCGAVHALLALAAEAGPLLVVVDDLQWLDDESRASVLFAARELRDAGTAVLLAARDGESTAIDATGIKTLHLQGLAATDAEALLRSRWEDLEPGVMQALISRTGGNPLALLEVPSSLSPAQRSGTAVATLSAAVPLGRQLQDAFSSQLRALPENVGRAAAIAAALGGERAAVLEAALGAFDLPRDVIADAEAAEVFAIEHDHVVFRHPLLAAAAYQDRPSSERRATHEVLAGLCVDPLRAAWHRSSAAQGPDDAVAEALDEAGAIARARGAHVSAAAAYVRAAELSTSSDARAARELAAAREHAVAGRTVAALALIADGLKRRPDGEIRSALIRLQAHVELRDGSPRTAERLLDEEATRLIDAGQPQAAALCVLESSFTHMVSGHMGSLQAAAARAADLAGPDVAEVQLLAWLIEGEALLAMGRTKEGLARIDAAQPIIDGIDPAAEAADAVTMAAHALQWVDDFDRSSAILARMTAGARRVGASGRLAYPLAVRAMLDWRRARLPEAKAAADEALRLADLSTQATISTMTCAYLARIDAARGDEAGAEAHAARGLALAAGGGGDAVHLHVLTGRGFAELSASRPQQAAATLDEADAWSRRLAHGEPTLMLYAADHVEALVRCGRDDDARAALGRLQEAARTTLSAWTKAVALRGELLLADDAEIDGLAAAALRHHAAVETPLERARTELVYGERLRRARRRGDARAPLESAIAAFDRIGARAWASRARDELRATGARPVGAAPQPALADVSPRELQVAELVAEGLTNREVAATLFLSARTVEHHLSSIYRKLDVGSRMQLAQRLAQPG